MCIYIQCVSSTTRNVLFRYMYIYSCVILVKVSRIRLAWNLVCTAHLLRALAGITGRHETRGQRASTTGLVVSGAMVSVEGGGGAGGADFL